MNRSLKLSMLIAMALGSAHALAESLGPVHVKSTLSQPLLAEIPINGATAAELRSLSVQLASSDDFTRAGITGGRPAIPLTLSVVTSNNQPVIRITSSVAVDDPYLDLLIEVNGGKDGNMVREFAILLDPEKTALAAAATPATLAARETLPRPTRVDAPEPSSATRRADTVAPAKAEPMVASANKGSYGPVKSGDTLSSIARDSRATGVSLNQMLLALKVANPDAFYRDNINALKRGAILRIPTASEAKSLATAEAIAEVHRQNSDWRSGNVGKPTTVADGATRAAASSAPTTLGKTTSDRLALVATDPKGESGPGSKADNSVGATRADLQRTQESLASVQQQSNDLKVRLQDLTEINSKNVNLLSLKDSEIADLQSRLTAARKAAGLPVRASSAPISAAVATPSSAAAATAVTVAAPIAVIHPPVASAATGSALPGAASAAKVEVTPVALSSAVSKPAPAVVAPMTPKPASAVPADEPWYTQMWALGAGAVALVLLGLLAWLSRRRAAQGQRAQSPSSLADHFISESSGHDDTDTDQNELLDQLAEHPDDIGLHLELVTLYYSRRDVDHFEAAAEAMHAHITDTDQDEWQDVLHMGEDLAPGHPLFDHHLTPPLNPVSEAHRSFDLDDYAADEPSTPPAPVVPSMPPLPLPPSRMVSEFRFDPSTPTKAAAPDAGVESPPSHALADPELRTAIPIKTTSSWDFDDAADAGHKGAFASADLGSALPGSDDFSDDPVDTKLDLARAYVDMGDPEGARAMLDEVIKEGSQIQQDIAKRLLETLD